MNNDRLVRIEAEQLLILREDPNISSKALRRAFELAFPNPSSNEWQSFLTRLFYSLGSALLVCGLLFFAKQFWPDMSFFQRAGLFGSSTLLAALVAWKRGYKTTAGKISTTCASILLGGFLLVVGEGEPVHLTLTLWSALILPWCISAEFAPLWLFATCLINITLFQSCRALFDPWFFRAHLHDVALLLLNVGLLSSWEIGFRQGRTWMGRRWFPPFLTLLGLAPLTLATCGLISRGTGWTLPLIGLILSWTGFLFYYSQVRRDVSVLAMTLASCVTVGTSSLFKFLNGFDPALTQLLLAVGLIAQVSAALGALRKLAPPVPLEDRDIPESSPDVNILLGRLATENYINSSQVESVAKAMRVQSEPALPWFVRALTGLGALMASVFLLAYLFLTDIVSLEDGVFFGFVLCSAACMGARVNSDFVRQASLSVSLCGQLMVWLCQTYTSNDPQINALVLMGLHAGLVIFYPGVFGKFLSVNCFGLLGARLAYLVFGPVAVDGYILILAAFMVFIWLRQREFLASPLCHIHGPASLGSACVLFTLLLSTLSSSHHYPEAGIVTAIGLTSLVLWTANLMGAQPQILLGLALMGAISSSAPGVMAAVLVLMLGFYRRNQNLQTLAILFLLGFGSSYYYHLPLGLLSKAGILSATGLICLYLGKFADLQRLKETSSQAD